MAKVLLIESDKILANNISAVLAKAGHDTDWQLEPQSAIDSADQQTPNVVIMDLMLAGRSGAEFINEFRSYPDWQELPIIVYSDVPQAEFSSSGFDQLGIAAYLQKSTTSLQELTQQLGLVLQAS